jgi:ribulose-phosphate 3-epimerase
MQSPFAFNPRVELFSQEYAFFCSLQQQWVDDFAAAGADQFTFHIEATADAPALVAKIKAAGMQAGVAISPDTPHSAIDAIAAACDLLLVMSVHPGFGGQKFMPSVLPKIKVCASS